MPGFYDQGYNSPDPGIGSSNNAANDFAAASGSNPGQFSGDGLFDRLFGSKTKSGSGKKGEITASDVNPAPPPAATPVTASNRPPPAISSAPSLVKRIIANSNPATALVPGTGMTASEFAMSTAKKTAETIAQSQPPAPRQPLPPFQGIPQFPNPQPPARQAPSPYGNQTVGGAQFGGNQFGGNQFGGNQFGASAPPPAPPSPPNGGMSPMPNQPPAPLDQLRALAQPQYSVGNLPRPGFFGGGPVHLARGGYPELMGGLPVRHHFATGGPDGNAVPGNGSGDGRSDHVKAMLSPGEFVMDAETTALTGNGDSDAGARGMEAIRQEIRKHKGKALAKGKFSPDAPPPKKLAHIAMKAAQ